MFARLGLDLKRDAFRKVSNCQRARLAFSAAMPYLFHEQKRPVQLQHRKAARFACAPLIPSCRVAQHLLI